MHIFLSWSGPRSKAVAGALREWLPAVVQEAQPWMSDKDIQAGAKWDEEITRHLDEAVVGIICVTRDNQDKVWLNFEAGAVSRSIDDGARRVIPLLVDFSDKTELTGPLSSFQAVMADKDGLLSILQTIESTADNKLGRDRLIKTLDVWWPDLSIQLESIRTEHAQPTLEQPRTAEDMLREVLTLVRDMSKSPPPAPTQARSRRPAATTRTKAPLKSVSAVVNDIRQVVRIQGGSDAEVTFKWPTDEDVLVLVNSTLTDDVVDRLIEIGDQVGVRVSVRMPVDKPVYLPGSTVEVGT